MTARSRTTTLLVAGGVCAAFAFFVAATGGIDTRIAGVAVRSRSWERPAILAALLTAAGLFSARRAAVALALRAWRVIPALLVAAALAVSLAFGTYAAGGADSFGYISQAELLAHGRLVDVMPSHPAFDWPDVPYTLTPLAFTRNRDRTALVPIYPPGLPLMMAPLARIHPAAVFAVVPFCAGLTIWLCVMLGRELDEPLAGTLGALLMTVSPTFILQSVQPMSDVPVTALWLSALLLARRPSAAAPIWSGLVASLAILVRPNLAPLALLVATACASRTPLAIDVQPARLRLGRAFSCLAAIVPGVIALGLIQARRYGSPLASGYGSFDDLFGLSNIAPNLSRYPRWMIEAHTPFVWLWIAAPLTFGSARSGRRTFAWILYAFAAAVVLAYLPYVYFQPHEWSYTRFLLPALPVMMVLGAMTVIVVARRASPRAAVAVPVLLCVVVAGWSLRNATGLGVFRMRQAEEKYSQVGAFVRDRLPKTAFVLAAQHSGSVRYYSGRSTLRWDLLQAGSLDRAIRALRTAGYEPFVVLDAGEDEQFRARFAPSEQHAASALTPLATIGNTSIYGFE